MVRVWSSCNSPLLLVFVLVGGVAAETPHVTAKISTREEVDNVCDLVRTLQGISISVGIDLRSVTSGDCAWSHERTISRAKETTNTITRHLKRVDGALGHLSARGEALARVAKAKASVEAARAAVSALEDRIQNATRGVVAVQNLRAELLNKSRKATDDAFQAHPTVRAHIDHMKHNASQQEVREAAEKCSQWSKYDVTAKSLNETVRKAKSYMENAAVRDLVHRAVTSMTDFADLVKHFKNKMSLLCDAAENATAGLSEAAALVADKHETDIKEAVQSVELELRALMEEMKRDEEVMMEVGREVKEEVKKIEDSESEGVSISGNADKAEEEVVGEGDVEARTKAQPSVVSPRAEAQKASATPNTFETETDVGNEVISDARKAQHTMRRTALIAVAVVVVVMSFVGLAAILHRQLATKSSNVLV